MYWLNEMPNAAPIGISSSNLSLVEWEQVPCRGLQPLFNKEIDQKEEGEVKQTAAQAHRTGEERSGEQLKEKEKFNQLNCLTNNSNAAPFELSIR